MRNMNNITTEDIRNAIRNIPDFPVPGIMFKDITTVLKRADYFSFIVDYFYEKFKKEGITKLACVESRGFILGGALAHRLETGFVPVRKPGKLPSETYSVEYQLEYGTDKLEVHKDAFTNDDIVLIHDDLLATGGTARATYELISNFNVKKMFFCFFCELDFLNGRAALEKLAPVNSMIHF